VPCQNKLYYSAKNYGSFAVDLDKSLLKLFDEDDKIQVSDRKKDLVVMKSRSHNDDRLDELLEKNKDKIKSETESGSSLKGCLIAEGVADIYYRFGYTMEWDTCAMQSIVIEAGGVFIQGDKSEMEYNRVNSLNDKGFIILNREENMLDV
jgi:3'(2'), 5'-bisphosphate nucleotidase